MLVYLNFSYPFSSNFGLGEDVTSNKSSFIRNDILYGKLRPYFHKVCLALDSGICSTDILVLRAKESIFLAYLTLNLNDDKLVEYANIRSTGTRMPRADAKDILNYKIVDIPKDVSSKFNSIILGMFNKAQSNNNENQTLAKLRDTLLPKLMSGELRLEDAVTLVEEV